MSLTTKRNDPDLGYGIDEEPIPQHKKYLVLSDDEIAKGYQRPVRQSYIHKVCGTVTTMDRRIAETYAREPSFYGATYCTFCHMHKPVKEFVWEDESEVGS